MGWGISGEGRGVVFCVWVWKMGALDAHKRDYIRWGGVTQITLLIMLTVGVFISKVGYISKKGGKMDHINGFLTAVGTLAAGLAALIEAINRFRKPPKKKKKKRK